MTLRGDTECDTTRLLHKHSRSGMLYTRQDRERDHKENLSSLQLLYRMR